MYEKFILISPELLENQGGFSSPRIAVIPTGNMKRLNISMDASLVNEIDEMAKRVGRNRSEFLSDAAREMLS